MSAERAAQLEYSEFQAAMLDEDKRRRKAAKIIAVLAHFLGRDTAKPGEVLSGLTVGDVGCSAGFIADELAAAGARRTLGLDIDVPGLRKASDRFGGGSGSSARTAPACRSRTGRSTCWSSTTSTSTWWTPTP